jgi:hypothetical protein
MIPWIVAGWCCPLQGEVQPPAKPAAAKVTVTVVVILASERCQHIDPRLKNIAAEIQKANPNYTGFTLVSMTEAALPVNEKTVFACVEEAKLELTVRQCPDKNGKVCLAVKAPLQDEIVYSAVCGKFFLIVTRYQTRERVPVRWVAQALGQALGGPLGPLVALETLQEGRSRDRLIVGVCGKPCEDK